MGHPKNRLRSSRLLQSRASWQLLPKNPALYFVHQIRQAPASFVLAKFSVKSARRNSEYGRGSLAVAVALIEHAQDVLAFQFSEAQGRGLGCPGRTLTAESGAGERQNLR